MQKKSNQNKTSFLGFLGFLGFFCLILTWTTGMLSFRDYYYDSSYRVSRLFSFLICPPIGNVRTNYLQSTRRRGVLCRDCWRPLNKSLQIGYDHFSSNALSNNKYQNPINTFDVLFFFFSPSVLTSLQTKDWFHVSGRRLIKNSNEKRIKNKKK